MCDRNFSLGTDEIIISQRSLQQGVVVCHGVPHHLGVDELPLDEGPNLTPVIDVVFLLLIFFMITASFTMQKAIAFPPPSPEEEGASVQPKQIEDFKDDCVIVEIHEDNSISIDDERIPLDADLAAMLASKGKNEMLIDAHENSLHETVVKVVDAGNEVQMQKIRLGSRGG